MAATKEVIISDDHEALLKTALQLDTRNKVPAKALEMYGEIRTSLRRLGSHMSIEMIALVPVLLNRVARPEPKTFVDEIAEAEEEVKYGTRVVAKFRNKWQAGRFVRLDNSKVVVVLDDDTAEERHIGVTLVRLATKADLAKLGEKRMTTSVQSYAKIGARIDGRETRGGSIDSPASFTIAGQKVDETFSIANAANTAIYANALGAFKCIFLESDLNTRVLLTDTANTTFSLGLRGSGTSGKYGVGMMIGLGTTLNTSTTINAVSVFNDVNANATAKVHAIILK